MYDQALKYLDELSSEFVFFNKKLKPSIDNVKKVLELLNNPDKDYRYRIIVSGTVGKGTQCKFIEQSLLKKGKSVCTLVSPHLQVVNERIKINGKLISKDLFGENILEIKKVCENNNIKLTYYEIIVVCGILSGSKSNCEILICEIGLGGKFDAVNCVKGKRISVLTCVGMDHQEILGDTLEKICLEKIGIFTKYTVLGLTYEKNLKEFIKQNCDNEIKFINEENHTNAKKIITKKILKYIVDEKYCVENVKLACRWEKINKDLVLDGAHSEPRFLDVAKKLENYDFKKVAIIAMRSNHNLNKLKIIEKYFDEIILTKFDSIFSFHKPEKVNSEIKNGIIIENLDEALEYAKKLKKKIYVLGSFYLAGKIREKYFPNEKILETQNEFCDR